MEYQQGPAELLLTCQAAADGLHILRCAASGPTVSLPEAVLGCPVTALGPYALAEREPPDLPARAVQVRVGCGGPEPVHRAESIAHILLPASLQRIGDCAFYNCRGLRRLSLYGGVSVLGGDAFLNCTALERVALSLGADGRSCLRLLLAQCPGNLEVLLSLPGGTAALLFFPGYHERLDLLVAPHIFQNRIEGAGYAYRQCIQNGVLSFAQYDGCLARLMQTHDFASAVRVALGRLRWPQGLSPRAEQAYSAVLRGHGSLAAERLLDGNDTEGLAFLLGLGVLDPEALSATCNKARLGGKTEALALLLEAARPSPVLGKTYEL